MNWNKVKAYAPVDGDLGEEVETIEVLPAEEPLSVPAPEIVPAEPEKVPA